MTPTPDQLDLLQQAGIISDNALSWDDVPECDRERALRWLGVDSEMPGTGELWG